MFTYQSYLRFLVTRTLCLHPINVLMNEWLILNEWKHSKSNLMKVLIVHGEGSWWYINLYLWLHTRYSQHHGGTAASPSCSPVVQVVHVVAHADWISVLARFVFFAQLLGGQVGRGRLAETAAARAPSILADARYENIFTPVLLSYMLTFPIIAGYFIHVA